MEKVNGIDKFEYEAAKRCPLYVIDQEFPECPMWTS